MFQNTLTKREEETEEEEEEEEIEDDQFVDLLCDAQDAWFRGDFRASLNSAQKALERANQIRSESNVATRRTLANGIFEAHEMICLSLRELGDYSPVAFKETLNWVARSSSVLSEQQQQQRTLRLVIELSYMASESTTLQSALGLLWSLFLSKVDENETQHEFLNTKKAILWDIAVGSILLLDNDASCSSVVDQVLSNNTAISISASLISSLGAWKLLKEGNEREGRKALESRIEGEKLEDRKSVAKLLLAVALYDSKETGSDHELSHLVDDSKDYEYFTSLQTLSSQTGSSFKHSEVHPLVRKRKSNNNL